MTSPKISIIVPVYNVEKFLNKCIESILSQTYSNFELILVDDGSKDSCGTICDYYVSKDERVKVYHKENGGVSSARNLGIDRSIGEWVLFVDADDRIESNMLYSLMSQQEITLCDAIMFDFKREIKLNKYIDVPSNLTSQLYETNNHLFIKVMKAQVWNYLFRTSILKKYSIHFDENIHYGEDVLFICDYFVKCDRIFFDDGLYYIYNEYNVSATTFISIEKNSEHLAVAEKIFNIQSDNPELVLYWTASMCIRYLDCLAFNKELGFNTLVKFSKYFTNNYSHIVLKVKKYVNYKTYFKLRYPLCYILYFKKRYN